MKTYVYFIIFAALVVGGILLFSSKGSSDTETGNYANVPSTSGNQNGEIQNVVLSYKDYNYYPNTITVKAGQPVRISLDSSVSGCYRTFTIPDFKINKNLRTPSDYVEFTPTEKGTHRFACIMGMGYGQLIVE